MDKNNQEENDGIQFAGEDNAVVIPLGDALAKWATSDERGDFFKAVGEEWEARRLWEVKRLFANRFYQDDD